MRRLVLDLDDILAAADGQDDADLCGSLAARIGAYREMGFKIVLTSSGDLLSQWGDPRQAATAPTALLRRLDELGIACDEIVLTRPPAGQTTLVLDDKAITPEEFLTRDYAQICRMVDVDARKARR